jgi:hypothetical protein
MPTASGSRVTFDIVSLSAWVPHAGQPKTAQAGFCVDAARRPFRRGGTPAQEKAAASGYRQRPRRR